MKTVKNLPNGVTSGMQARIKAMQAARAATHTGPALQGQEIIQTDTPCPRCAEEGKKTLGGNTPTLNVIHPKDAGPGQVGREFCHTHGWA